MFQTSPNLIDINRLDDGTYIDANKAYLDILGFEREEVIGRTSQELNIWADPSDLQDIVELLRQKQVFRGEIKQRKKNGETFWGLMSASVFEYEGTSCVLSVTQDISDVKAAQDEIRDLSFYDPLTRLPNRRLLLNRLRRSPIATARNRHRRALLFVDLDNFKSLNDTLGHQTGDLLLQEAALRLGSCVRDSDTVARCGGDEFAVMLENLSEVVEEAIAQAQIVGEKILAICGLPYLLIGHECHCPSSVGITVFGDEQESAKDALQRAEIAMFEAKKAGRNTLRFFAPALQAAVSARATMEEDLREAIKTNQFVLYYQPQVEQDGPVSAEALVRWRHPQRGLLMPCEFIAMAEETGLIIPLGDWVLETACRQLATWESRAETAHLTVSVNVSARQFCQPDFVQRVLAALERSGADPTRLKLELTESILVDDIEEVIATMNELKSIGLRFSLDDFGTAGPLVDLVKLDDISADHIATLPAPVILAQVITWAQAYDPPLAEVLAAEPDLALGALAIEREGVPNPRKDLRRWADFRAVYGYFFPQIFEPVTDAADPRFGGLDAGTVRPVAEEFGSRYQPPSADTEWFGQIRDLAARLGFAPNQKAYKQDPGSYRGSIRDASQVIRVLLTGTTRSPDLAAVAGVLGTEEVLGRVRAVLGQPSEA